MFQLAGFYCISDLDYSAVHLAVRSSSNSIRTCKAASGIGRTARSGAIAGGQLPRRSHVSLIHLVVTSP